MTSLTTVCGTERLGPESPSVGTPRIGMSLRRSVLPHTRNDCVHDSLGKAVAQWEMRLQEPVVGGSVDQVEDDFWVRLGRGVRHAQWTMVRCRRGGRGFDQAAAAGLFAIGRRLDPVADQGRGPVFSGTRQLVFGLLAAGLTLGSAI